MRHKEQEVYAIRERKQSHYEQMLILKVVKEVGTGLPRKEANRIYELGKSCLYNWMRKYGSMNYHQNVKRKSYTNLQKRTVVTTIEQGKMSIKEPQTAYSVIIRNRLEQYKAEKVELYIITETVMAKKTKPVSPAQAEALQKALEEVELKIKALKTLINVPKEQLKINIRKKSGAKQNYQI